MNVLVTGSSGYLASLVLPRLAADPEVGGLHGLDLRPPPAPPPRLVHHAGSVLSHSSGDDALARVLEAQRFDVVLHLAWVFNPTHDREAMRRIDVDGTRNVVERCAAAGVPHVVYLSSTTAYGAHPGNAGRRLTETDPTPGSSGFPYSADKAAVEAVLDDLARRHPALGLTRLRPCIVLGGRTDNFVRALLRMPVIVTLRGHDPGLQFLHEDDLADCLARVVRRRPPGAYNLAPADTVRMSELAGLLGRPALALPEALARAAVAALWRLHLVGVPAGYLDFIKWPWVADGSKLSAELGFTPRRSSRDAVLAAREAGSGAAQPAV